MRTFTPLKFCCPSRTFTCQQQPIIMGILNITPDSFSDGGEFFSLESAVQHALQMQNAGADILDIGGESTRPGSASITPEQEQERIIPIISHLKERLSIPISVDTWHASTAEKAVEAGAEIINDVGGFDWDPMMLQVAKNCQAGLIVMHSRGTPETMSQLTQYQDLIGDISLWWKSKIQQCLQAGIAYERLMFDPGIGFAKDTQQNLELLRATATFREIGRPVLIGTSRKRFIGELLQLSQAKDRISGTIGSCIAAMFNGADVLRVHDVKEVYQACKIAKLSTFVPTIQP